MTNFDDYIKEAGRLLEVAKKELDRAQKEKDNDHAREVCEKGYLALLTATNAFFRKKGVKDKELPKGDRGRYFFLRKYAPKPLRNKFFQLRDSLHILGFHEAIIDFAGIKDELEDVEWFINEVKEM